MSYIAFSLDKLQTILKGRGLKDRDLVKLMYGAESHQTFKTIFTKQFGWQKLVDVCNTLDIQLDDLFEISTDSAQLPTIQGNFNNPTYTSTNHDFASLRSENEALKLLIKEKDSRIEDLQRNFDKVVELARFGRVSDCTEDV